MNDKILEGYRGPTPPYLDITQLRIKPLLEKNDQLLKEEGKEIGALEKAKETAKICFQWV